MLLFVIISSIYTKGIVCAIGSAAELAGDSTVLEKSDRIIYQAN